MHRIFEVVQFLKDNKTILQKYARWDFHSDYLQKFQKHQKNALFLLLLETPAELCRFFDISIFQLEEIINSPVYEHHVISKKRGGERHIYAPEEQLKKIQKRLNYFLQAYYLWIKPGEVHGFVINPHYLDKYCNIAANAHVHTGKKYVLNIDLKDFFPSISAKRIKNLFSSSFFNYNEQLATALTLLTTYESKLPTGAPTSPVLSNFVCYNLDTDLQNFSQENRLLYTRYADDLTFSSNTVIQYDSILDIILLIKKNGFEINDKKLHLQSSNRKQTVTGLTVNEKVNVDRKLLKKIRAMLHDLSINGIDTATQRHFQLKSSVSPELRKHFIRRLAGYINFVGQVRGENDVIYQKLQGAFDSSI